MSIGVYYIESTNEDSEVINRYNRDLIEELGRCGKLDIEFCRLLDLASHDLPVVFIGGGGVENRFKEICGQLEGKVFLLATAKNNSLAASMEILSYLRNIGRQGQIIHGSVKSMAENLASLEKVYGVRKRLSHFVLGRVGKPSDWLISSDVDAEESERRNGIKIIDISMEELLTEFRKGEYEDNQYTRLIKAKGVYIEETERCCQLYGALKRIAVKYHLNGLTVRCFDLLQYKVTGCLALAVLNAEGIYASCEGDVPALVSMCVLGELSGKPVFMANPSSIDTDNETMVFAHCTLPISMPASFEIMTHFESGLPVAFRGKIEEGPITVFKCSGLMDRMFVSSGVLLENMNERNLCRTQIRVKLNKQALAYFFNESIGNHHLIVNGDYSELVRQYFETMN